MPQRLGISRVHFQISCRTHKPRLTRNFLGLGIKIRFSAFPKFCSRVFHFLWHYSRYEEGRIFLHPEESLVLTDHLGLGNTVPRLIRGGSWGLHTYNSSTDERKARGLLSWRQPGIQSENYQNHRQKDCL